MPPNSLHQELVMFLAKLLGNFADLFGLGKVYSSPYEMKCRPDGPSREPDVLFIAKTNQSRIGAARLEGPADLVIEIVSDDSVSRDFDDKFIEYQECGVSEYWIVDPRERRKRALFYHGGEGGLFESAKLETGGIYRSKAVPGFWLKTEWLWEMPDPLLTFAEIAGFSEQMREELRARKQ
ncbi:MAG: Uma2 family endonuclease [Chloroflexi bacterium]|nr:Uma2 family endonuclease [Chloroflexota bacterium]